MSGFTPGPWRYVAGEILAANKGPRAGKVASLAIAFKDSAERDANARLIAAAPELYEALKELVDTLRREAPGTTLNNHKFDALGLKANKALAKARGEA